MVVVKMLSNHVALQPYKHNVGRSRSLQAVRRKQKRG